MAVVSSQRWAQPTQEQWGTLRRTTVRVLAVVAMLAFGFILVFAIADATGRVGDVPDLVPAGSAEARLGAAHPGEAVHIAAALAALGVGLSGLVGLAIRPQRAGSALQSAASALAMLAVIVLVGNPDNHGGQAGLVDPAFLVLAIPPLAAVATAAPWRTWWRGGLQRPYLQRPYLLVFAALLLPAAWFGVDQALMQRNTWPPMADPHHQAHWYAVAVFALMVAPVVAGAAAAGRGWRTATAACGTAVAGVALASLLAPDAASAWHPAWAVAALLWAAGLMVFTWQAGERVTPRRSVPTAVTP